MGTATFSMSIDNTADASCRWVGPLHLSTGLTLQSRDNHPDLSKRAADRHDHEQDYQEGPLPVPPLMHLPPGAASAMLYLDNRLHCVCSVGPLQAVGGGALLHWSLT
jgi:hypothetical protein